MAIETLPTLEEITKKLEESNGKKAPVTSEDIPTSSSKDDASAAPSEETLAEVVEEVAAKVDEDAPVEEVAPKKDDQWSKRFAAMTRADKQRRQKEAELSQKMEAFEARQRALEEREAKLLKAKDPLEALKLHGYSYEDASYAILGGAPEKEVDPLDARVKSHLDPIATKMSEIDKRIADIDAAAKRLEADRQQQAEREIKFSIQSTATEGDYPYIRGLGEEAHSMVYDLMLEYYEKHKQSLTYKQACDKVEGYFKRIGSIGGSSANTVTDARAPKKATTPAPSADAAPAKTLTQSHSTSARPKQDLDSLPDYEAKKRIATMLKFR